VTYCGSLAAPWCYRVNGAQVDKEDSAWGINSVSTEVVNGYELRLQIGLASYRVRFSVVGSDPLHYAGARLVDR
jgi:hypothetical protein